MIGLGWARTLPGPNLLTEAIVRLRILREVIELLAVVVPAVLLAALIAIVTADVVSRNFFSMSILWAQELAVVLMAATVWLGLAGAAANGQLFGISLFLDRLPQHFYNVMRLLADVLTMLIAALVIRAAVAQISTARFTTFLTLGWPKWIIAALLAAGMTLVIVGRLVEIVEIRLKVRS